MNKGIEIVLVLMASLGGYALHAYQQRDYVPPVGEWSFEYARAGTCINFSGLSSTTAGKEKTGEDISRYCDLFVGTYYNSVPSTGETVKIQGTAEEFPFNP